MVSISCMQTGLRQFNTHWARYHNERRLLPWSAAAGYAYFHPFTMLFCLCTLVTNTMVTASNLYHILYSAQYMYGIERHWRSNVSIEFSQRRWHNRKSAHQRRAIRGIYHCPRGPIWLYSVPELFLEAMDRILENAVRQIGIVKPEIIFRPWPFSTLIFPTKLSF